MEQDFRNAAQEAVTAIVSVPERGRRGGDTRNKKPPFMLDDIKASIRETIIQTGEGPYTNKPVEYGPIKDGVTLWSDINSAIIQKTRGFEKTRLNRLGELIAIVRKEMKDGVASTMPMNFDPISTELRLAFVIAQPTLRDRAHILNAADRELKSVVRTALENMYPNNDPTKESLSARTEEFEARVELARQSLGLRLQAD